MMEQYVNKIFNMDCLEFMKQLPDNSIDMILCDLPYGTTACKWDIIIPFEPLWEAYKRIIKENGAIILTASQPFTSKLVISNLDMFKYEWIWEKSTVYGFVHSKNQPMKEHENILVFSKAPMGHISLLKDKRMNYNPVGIINNGTKKVNAKPKTLGQRKKQEGKLYTSQTGFPKTIIRFKNDKGLHPTQKPVALFSYLIQTYTNKNDIVFDNCSGSGTTAISCLETNRKYICCELDSNYYNISLKRIDDYNKQLKLF